MCARRIRAVVWQLAVAASLWSVMAKAPAQQPELVLQSGHASPVNAVSFSPDGKLLASGSGEHWSLVEKNVIKLWDVASGMELRTFVYREPVSWLGFSNDGRTLVALGSSGFVPGKTQAWNVATGAEVTPAPQQADCFSSAASGDDAMAAEIDGKTIKLRDLAGGKLIRTLASRTSDFQKAMFSPDNAILACGGERFSIRLWDLRSGVLRTLEGHTDMPIVADFSPDSRLFASGGRDLTVRLWDSASGREVKTLTGHTGQYIKGMHFSPNGKTLLSFDKAGFKLWEVATGRELVSAAGDHDDAYRYVIFSPRGDLLAAVTVEGIKLWAADTGRELRLLSGKGGSLEFSPDGQLLLAHGLSNVGLWHAQSGRQLASVQPSAKGESFTDVAFIRWAFSPDSRHLAFSEYDSRDGFDAWRLYLHDTVTGERLRTIEPEHKDVDAYGRIAFSGDSRQIRFDSGSGLVAWNVVDGRPVELAAGETLAEEISSAPYHFGFGNSGELDLYDAKTNRKVVSLVGIDEKDWLVATEEGFFDGSPNAWKQIYWRFNNDTFNHVPLEAFFNEFFHPGLLQDVLSGRRPRRRWERPVSR